MSEFEYLTVLFSIIIGLGLTHLLSGLGKAFYTRKTNHMDIVHVAWTTTTFLVMVLNWWVILLWEAFDNWNFLTFLLMTVWITTFYAMAQALYPARLPEKISYRVLFEENRTWFLSTFATMCLLDILVAIVRDGGWPNPTYVSYVGHLFVLTLIGVFIKKRWFDLSLAFWVAFSLLAWSLSVRYEL